MPHTSRRFREIVLFVVGVAAPIGILVVNGSAFVMTHLGEFRTAIAAAALVSSLLLNGLTAWFVLAFAQRQATALYAEYRRWLVGLAALVVAATSAGAGYFTYVGMRDPRHLPNRVAVITAFLALFVPLGITWISRRMAARRDAGRRTRAAGTNHPEAPI
ncbi:MAG: hypothetical protein ACREPI_13165 [Candidatus Dormibacterales bacterium]